MIEIFCEGHNFDYEIKDIINLFYNSHSTPLLKERGIIILSKVSENNGVLEVYTKVESGEARFEDHIKSDIPKLKIPGKKAVKRLVKLGVLNVLKKMESKHIPWGTLTGIRPTKVVKELRDRGYSKDTLIRMLIQEFGVSEEKARLMAEVTQNEKKFLSNNDINKISIYLGIPFCPDKCLYCSFTTNPIKRFNKLVEPFMTAVQKEIEAVGEIVKQKGWEIETVYIGGGTPTSLSSRHIEELMKKLNKTFNLKSIKEVTVEAGRPDTFDKEKIEILKQYGANRISINPQTMNESTLELIGRNHTVENIKEAFEIARECGFDNINVDAITGLPGENIEMFDYTMKRVMGFSPESITVHTLALKKGSKLIQEKDKYALPEDIVVEQMLEKCRKYTREIGMIPYYMYRQKNMVGLQENIGYCFPEKECIYNIKMIEEAQNIIALGPGGVSRIMNFEIGAIDKIFNDRSTEGYIARIDEMIEKKIERIKK